VTEDIGFENYTSIWTKFTSPFNSGQWNFEEFGYRLLGVTGFDTVFHNTVLNIEMEITLANVVGWSSRTNKHHNFVITLLTFFIWLSLVNLCRII
jgi:hypothetical protein